MTEPTTIPFHGLILEVELDPVGAAGVYTKLCGFSSFNVGRALSTQEIALLDCEDYSLPLTRKIAGDIYSMSLSGAGVFAKENKDILIQWIAGGLEKGVRVAHIGGASGEILDESGIGLLTQLDNVMNKSSGPAVTADMAIELSGTVTINLVP